MHLFLTVVHSNEYAPYLRSNLRFKELPGSTYCNTGLHCLFPPMAGSVDSRLPVGACAAPCACLGRFRRLPGQLDSEDRPVRLCISASPGLSGVQPRPSGLLVIESDRQLRGVSHLGTDQEWQRRYERTSTKELQHGLRIRITDRIDDTAPSPTILTHASGAPFVAVIAAGEDWTIYGASRRTTSGLCRRGNEGDFVTHSRLRTHRPDSKCLDTPCCNWCQEVGSTE